MESGSVDIRVVAIDLDSIEGVEQSDEALEFAVTLSGTPTAGWLDEFEHLYGTVEHPIKPPVVADGDKLRIQFLPRYYDELQAYIDFVADICCRASDEVHQTIAIRTSEEGEERKRAFRRFLATMKVPDC